MPTINSKTLTARIRQEDMDVLEPILREKSFSEWVREQINTPSEDKDLAEIKSMVSFLEIPLSEFFTLLCSAMTEGQITVEEGEIKTRDSLDMDDFYDACHEAGIDPQKAVNKMTGMIRNGR